jgi:predicted MFS family arabinose efflux permease
MAISTESLAGRGALIVGHAAGMLDLVAAPVWVGVLVQFRHLSPLQAGLLMTVYTAGIFLTSITLAPRFTRLPQRPIAIAGFFLGALAFVAIIMLDGFAALVPAHFVAGIGAGSALSMVHGTISRSARPHRLFAIANLGVAIFSIAFFVGVPAAVPRDPNVVFFVLGGLLTLAGIAAAAAFPSAFAAGPAVASPAAAAGTGVSPYKLAVVLAFAGVTLMSIGQSNIYPFVERIGAWREFSPQSIANMLAISGILNLLAPIVAAVLENIVPRVATICVALLIHAVLTITASSSATFAPYAVAGSLLIFMTLFSHTFMFGLIAKIDPSGRTASSTPAMITLGAMMGPALGGAVAQYVGFYAIGWVSAALLLASSVCFFVIASMRLVALQAKPAVEAQTA